MCLQFKYKETAFYCRWNDKAELDKLIDILCVLFRSTGISYIGVKFIMLHQLKTILAWHLSCQLNKAKCVTKCMTQSM